MAKMIEEHRFSTRGALGFYPWADYFNGKIWKLKEGEDYTCAPSTFAVGAWAYRKKSGLVGTIRCDKNTPGFIFFQFIPAAAKHIRKAG